MAKAVLIDLWHLGTDAWNKGIQDSITGVLETIVKEDVSRSPFVYLMCFQAHSNEKNGKDLLQKALKSFHCPGKGLEVVSAETFAAVLYALKQKLDEKDVEVVTVMLSPERKSFMRTYIDQLFTSLYQFEFIDLGIKSEESPLKTSLELQSKTGPLSDPDVERIQMEIKQFLESLPSLKGNPTVLKSLLIPVVQSGGTHQPWLENLRRLSSAVGFNQDTYHSIKVNHANDVWVMGKPQPDSYDGIVTNQRGVTVAAPGADCIPVLFADPVQKVCGAAHSGWQGTLLGVSMAVVNAMVTEYGCNVKDILVVLGPSVGPCCYRLPQESAEKFYKIDPKCVRCFESPSPYVDIRRATRVLLEAGGILPRTFRMIP